MHTQCLSGHPIFPFDDSVIALIRCKCADKANLNWDTKLTVKYSYIGSDTSNVVLELPFHTLRRITLTVKFELIATNFVVLCL